MSARPIFVAPNLLLIAILCLQPTKMEATNAKSSSGSVALTLYTDCIDFAAKKHRDQRRLDAEQTPYINHPIGMTPICRTFVVLASAPC